MFEKLTHSIRNELDKQALCYGAMTEEILAVLLAYFVTHHKTPLRGGMFCFLWFFFGHTKARFLQLETGSLYCEVVFLWHSALPSPRISVLVFPLEP